MPNADTEAVQRVISEFAHAYRCTGIEEILVLLTDDATVHSHGFAPAKGNDAIRAWFDQLIETLPDENWILSEGPVEVTVHETLALAHREYTSTMEWVDLGVWRQFQRESFTLAKEENSEWKIRGYMSNFSHVERFVEDKLFNDLLHRIRLVRRRLRATHRATALARIQQQVEVLIDKIAQQQRFHEKFPGEWKVPEK
jgi:ketosteroid isomerase-like protein